MGKRKKKPIEKPEDPWDRWKAIQLTPDQVAAARAEVQERVDKAAAEGVYEKLLALRGKVHLDLDLDDLRKDRD